MTIFYFQNIKKYNILLTIYMEVKLIQYMLLCANFQNLCVLISVMFFFAFFSICTEISVFLNVHSQCFIVVHVWYSNFVCLT